MARWTVLGRVALVICVRRRLWLSVGPCMELADIHRVFDDLNINVKHTCKKSRA